MATYVKMATTTGTNVRLRKNYSNSSGVIIGDYGTQIFVGHDYYIENGGYQWWQASYWDGNSWQVGYIAGNYIDVFDENLSFVTNNYSSGATLNLSCSSLWGSYDQVDVSYTLIDSKGRYFDISGGSCSINLQSYYSYGETVSFTLTASYSHAYNNNTSYFQLPSKQATVSITASWNRISWSNPNVSASRSGGNINVSWNAATAGTGTSTIKYLVGVGNQSIGYDNLIYGPYTGTSCSFPYRHFNTTYYITVYAEAYDSSGNYITGLSSYNITGIRPSVAIPAASITKAGNPVVTHNGPTVTIYWQSATASNIGNNVLTQTLIGTSASGKTFSGEALLSAPTSSSQQSYTISDNFSYDEKWTFYVIANAGDGDGQDISAQSGNTEITFYSPTLSVPTINTLTHSSSTFTVKWNAATGSYGGSGASVSYQLTYWDSSAGESGAKSVDMKTATQTTVARWITPTQSDITYSFKVTATYSSTPKKTSTSTKTIKLTAPSISWSNNTLTVEQVNNQAKVSWNAATINNNYSSHTLKYNLVCQIKGQGSTGEYLKNDITGTSHTFTPSSLMYGEELFFQVYAYADNVSGGKYSVDTYGVIKPPSVTTPGKPTVTLSGDKFKISWTASTGQYGAAGSSVWYRVHYFDSAGVVTKSYSTYVQTTTNSAEITKWVSASTTDITCSFFVVAFYDVAASTDSATATYTLTAQNPTITAQPSITSVSPTSGLSTTIKWSAATVSNQGTATIYYQYFVGPSSTYSDSYHVGTTTSLYATITEANILAKCGSTFDGTCYLFVRAYWDKDGATGGWSVPTAKTFTYTPHRTVKYYDGNGWVECIVFYYDGIDWRECIPYRYNGTGWDELSH